MLFGRGKTVGDPLTAHVKVRMVSLTGSIATGAHIIGHTASSIKRTHMELGGKAPVIVFDDADIDAVVDGVRTFGFYNAGQDCTAACRIYAQQGIYDQLVEKARGGGGQPENGGAGGRCHRTGSAELAGPS